MSQRLMARRFPRWASLRHGLGSCLAPCGASALALCFLAVPATGQLVGNPIYFSPRGTTGLMIAGDYGRGLNEASGKANFVGVRGALGISPVTVSAGIGILDADETDVTFGGNLEARVFGGSLSDVSVSVLGGAGYMKTGDPSASELEILSLPLGIGLGLRIPTSGFSVEPWVAPRLHIQRATATFAAFPHDIFISETDTRFAVSTGANLETAAGLGFHAAVDYLARTIDLIRGRHISPLRFGIGAHYTIRIPVFPNKK